MERVVVVFAAVQFLIVGVSLLTGAFAVRSHARAIGLRRTGR